MLYVYGMKSARDIERERRLIKALTGLDLPPAVRRREAGEAPAYDPVAGRTTLATAGQSCQVAFGEIPDPATNFKQCAGGQ